MAKINVLDDETTMSQVKEELHSVKQQMTEMEQKMKSMEFKNKQLKAQLEEMTEEKDDAMERVVNLEKAKNVAVLAAVDAAVAAANARPLSSRFGKPPLSSKATDEMNGVSTANDKMSGQVGFLANVIDRLVTKKDESVEFEYTKRQETPIHAFESDSTIDGIRQNIKADSSKTIMSEITTATRYGSHRSVSDGEDPTPLPILGLSEKVIEIHIKHKIDVANIDEDAPSATETSGSEVKEEEDLSYGVPLNGIPIE
jgi:hypothetical protein